MIATSEEQKKRHLLKKAHAFCSHNREALTLPDAMAGCFYCKISFMAEEITEWIDEDQTALCPYCQIDSVIACVNPVERIPADYPQFLEDMHERWFSESFDKVLSRAQQSRIDMDAHHKQEEFEQALKNASDALRVIGTGKLRSMPLVKEGPRSYSPSRRDKTEELLKKVEKATKEEYKRIRESDLKASKDTARVAYATGSEEIPGWGPVDYGAKHDEMVSKIIKEELARDAESFYKRPWRALVRYFS